MLKKVLTYGAITVLLLVLTGSALLLGYTLKGNGYELPTVPAIGEKQATDVPTAEPHPVGEIKIEEKEDKSLVVDYHAAENYVPLVANDKTIGVFYALNQEGPAEVPYPYQATVLVTAGNMKINGEWEFTTDGTIGNIFADVCQDEKGCSVMVSDYVSGHAGVTIIFGGNEIPNATLAGSVNTMLEGASNCGNKCLTIVVGDAKGKTESYTAKVEAGSFNLKAPEAPYAYVNFILPNVPAGSEVILDGKRPIGHTYFLSDTVSQVSIPETSGTVIYCGSKCTVDGTTYDAGTAVSLPGGPTDGKTPEDLNRTVTIESKDFSMIHVFMYYSGDFQTHVSALTTDHPDWTWK